MALLLTLFCFRSTMFVLVVFTDENNIAVIPDNWLEEISCTVWPKNIKATGKLMKAAIEKMSSEDRWPAYPIKELYRNGKSIYCA